MPNLTHLPPSTGSFIGCGSPPATADTVLFGAPFDGTTSYRPGARFAPAAIRAESYGIETYSPYQERDLCDIRVHDAGDLELPFGNTARVLDMIESTTSEILADGKRPFMLGGEHLVTLGAVRAAVKKYPGVRVLHFDAHADLRGDYLGEQLSHATVMRRIWDIIGDSRIYQLGIRSGEREEFEFAAAHTAMCKFNLSALPGYIREIGEAPVYLSLDLDVLDSSVFPGTGTPEAGGVSFTELLGALISLRGLNIVAADICELSPPCDPAGASTAAACKLLRELLLICG